MKYEWRGLQAQCYSPDYAIRTHSLSHTARERYMYQNGVIRHEPITCSSELQGATHPRTAQFTQKLVMKERDSIQLFINGSMVTHKLSPSDCVGYEILSTLGSHGREMINSMTQGLRAGRDKLRTSQISREK